MQKLLTQGKVLTALHRGALIMVENLSGTDPKTVYRLTSNQKNVHKGLFDKLLAENLIKPNNDGLPGIGGSQTYSIVRSSDA